MNESGSSRSRATSKLMTPFVARAGVMISASATISSSLLSGLDRTLKRRMTIASPLDWDSWFEDQLEPGGRDVADPRAVDGAQPPVEWWAYRSPAVAVGVAPV